MKFREEPMMKLLFSQLVPLLLLFVAHRTTAFGGLSAWPNTFFQRKWKLRKSNNEDADFSNRINEIETMGGDPFFLSDDDNDSRTITPAAGLSRADTGSTIDFFRVDEIEAMGGDPFFLADDNMESEEEIDTVESDELSPLELLSQMSLLASNGGSGATSILQELDEKASALPKTNSREDTGSTIDSFRVDEIEAMGGDPFFLADDNMESEEEIDTLESDELSPLELLSQMSLLASNGGTGATSILQELDEKASKPTASNKEGENVVGEILALRGDPFFRSERGDDLSENRMVVDDRSEDNAYDEILASGGDPFFLQDDNYASSQISKQKDRATPENCHTDQEENDLSPMEILSKMTSLSANQNSDDARGILQELLARADSSHDDTSLSEVDLLEDVEAIGGDPFFLDISERDECPKEETSESSARLVLAVPESSTGSIQSGGRYVTDGQGPTPQIAKDKKLEDDHDWNWDGTIDEDAHFDLA